MSSSYQTLSVNQGGHTVRVLLEDLREKPGSYNPPRGYSAAESACAKELVAAALEQHLGYPPSQGLLASEYRLAGGKPCFPALPGFHYNVSHSGGVVVCAFADRPVGIDLQAIPDNIENARRIARRFYSPEEQEALEKHFRDGKEAELLRLFCRFWTARESYIKMTGRGLAEPFSGFRPDLRAGVIILRSCDVLRNVSLTECKAPDGFCMTVCLQTE